MSKPTLKLSQFIHSIENSGNFISWALFFSAIVLLRNGLESLITEQKLFKGEQFFSHYPIFYIAAFLLAAIWLSVFLGDAKKCSRVAVLGTSLILLAPILDLIIIGQGNPLGYLKFDNGWEYLFSALSFGMNLPFYPIDRGLTPGVRIELWIIYILMFAYAMLKQKNILKAFGAVYLFHLSLFLVPASISYIGENAAKFLINAFGDLFYGTKHISPASTLTIVMFILLFIWIALLDKRYYKAILLSVRPSRLVHYGGMLLAGIWLGCNGNISVLLQQNIFDILSIVIAYFCLWIFAVLINDYWDFKGDVISKNQRPVAIGLLSQNETFTFAWTSLIVGLVILGFQKGTLFKSSLLFAVVAYLYSSPPARAKRFPFLGTFALGLASLSGILIGYFSVHNDIAKFPAPVALAVLAGVTLGFITKDLKDIEGDKATGIVTIPTLMGERRARIVCAFGSAIAIVLIPIFTETLAAIPIIASIIFALVAGSYIAFAPKVDERLPLALYLFYAFLYIAFWYPFN